MRDWFSEKGVTHVAMESTGVYWKPIHALLEDGFEVVVGNAYHIKAVPGRKTDVKDAEWTASVRRSRQDPGAAGPLDSGRPRQPFLRFREGTNKKRTAALAAAFHAYGSLTKRSAAAFSDLGKARIVLAGDS